MALKRIAVADAVASKSKKKSMPEFATAGVAEFVNLTKEFDRVSGELNLAKAELKVNGVKSLLGYNVSAAEPTASVRLYEIRKDKNKNDERFDATMSFQDKYSETDATLAEATFGALGKDVNDYVIETVKASFDSSIFVVNGEFNQTVFNAIHAAVDKAVQGLKKKDILPEGTASPLSSKSVVVPKAGFHALRFKEFTVDQNIQISDVVKNTVTLKAG